MSLKEVMENQAELRQKLTTIMENKGISVVPLSKEMGISHVTLLNFLRKGQDVTKSVPLLKIKNYVEKNEK